MNIVNLVMRMRLVMDGLRVLEQSVLQRERPKGRPPVTDRDLIIGVRFLEELRYQLSLLDDAVESERAAGVRLNLTEHLTKEFDHRLIAQETLNEAQELIDRIKTSIARYQSGSKAVN